MGRSNAIAERAEVCGGPGSAFVRSILRVTDDRCCTRDGLPDDIISIFQRSRKSKRTPPQTWSLVRKRLGSDDCPLGDPSVLYPQPVPMEVTAGSIESATGLKMSESVTGLAKAMNRGETGAAGELLPLVYAELHRLASRYMRRERRDHTLQPTALINEAYPRLAWENDAVSPSDKSGM